jgi:hypothetical protein
MNLWRNELIAGVISSTQARRMGKVGCDCIPELICLTLTSRPIDDVPRGTHLNPCPLDRSSCQQVRERSTWNILSLTQFGLRKAPMTNDLFSIEIAIRSNATNLLIRSLEENVPRGTLPRVATVTAPADRELDPWAPSLCSSSFSFQPIQL